ncbi:hypothetical protein DMH15_28465 [Streptomyces sp. WAC 06725]|uniref:hypothetical protein n=1 Tax=Streptomyces sp. WAC 06725 TaxID=2203209 RepID=UPI000F73D2C1|nr:hypothetical protein [Streptomyces sp. WAC 06725]RSO27935.1 hypothetical protein DMH15_28465 [Streptomyces sp. WAC 06725]
MPAGLADAGLADDARSNSRRGGPAPGGEPAPVRPQPVVVPATSPRQRLLGCPRPLTEEIQTTGPAAEPHRALAPTADGEALLLRLGRHATGAR